MKNKFLTLLLSVVIAFGLWLYVVTVVSPESEASYYDIPVVFDGVTQLAERDLMITSGTDVTVDLHLSGNRTDLNKLDKTNITILADLSQIREAGEHKVKCSVSFPSNAGFIEVVDKDPEYITIQVSERVRKEVPVRVDYSGSVPDSFSADIQNAVLDYTNISITGPKEVVDQIAYAVIAVDLTDQTDTIVQTCRHTLCGQDGQPIEDVSSVTVNVSDIRVTVRVYQIKEVPLVLYVQDGGGLTQDMVKITPNRTSIMLSGSRTEMEKIDQIVLGTINLGELAEDTELLVFDITLPEGITNETGVWQVSVDVQMPQMETRKFRVTNFQVINADADKYVEVKTEVLIVKIRGPVELLDLIVETEIVAVVDCTDQTLLTNAMNKLQVVISIPDVEGVGSVGEYTLTAYVGEITGPEQGG